MSSDKKKEPSRRTVFKVALAGAGVAGLASLGLCMKDKGATLTAGSLPFDVWRSLRDALRTSSDHLVAQSEALVASGDADAIFRFVRDQITTYPSGSEDFTGQNNYTVRWGARAALRCGAGTPREKAEILADLLTRAGHNIELVSFHSPRDEAAIQALLDSHPLRRFDPAIGKGQLTKWRKTLGLPGKALPVESFDREGTEAQALFEHYAKSLPLDADARWPTARPFALRWRPPLAAVRIKEATGNRLLSPLRGEEALLETEENARELRVEPSRDAVGLIKVEVVLQAATTVDPHNRFDLASGQWTADQIVGRQLIVQTLPACLPENWATTRFTDVQSFLPIMCLQDPLGQEREAPIIGQVISSAGERIVVNDKGGVSMGENQVSGTASPRAKEVAKLEIETASEAFPRIDLKFNAFDKAGARIEGLSAADFSVFDNGQSVGFTLMADRESPRISVLIDRSGSMPSAYTGARMEAFYEELTEALHEVSPHAIVLPRPTNSELWTFLAGASVDSPAFIVYITDGDVDGKATPEILAHLAQGPKTLIIGVREDTSETLEAMARATSGKVSYASNKEDTKAAILTMLRAHSEPSYRIRYVAPHRSPGTHQSRILVSKSGSEAEAPYQVAEELPPGPPQLAGLYLKVKIDRQEHVRTLVGHDHRTPGLPISPETLAEVRAGMFGTTMVAFEAAAPPTSVWLDELLTARLSIEATHLALEKQDGVAARSALHEEFRYLPLDLCQTLMLELPGLGDETLTYQTSLRVGIYQETAVLESNKVRRRIDVLPSAEFRSAHTDAHAACELTARRTARLAVAEAARFESSSSEIRELPLSLLDGHSEAFRQLDKGEERRWREQLRGVTTHAWVIGAADARSRAFIRIDKGTGEVLAHMPGGGGGEAIDEGHSIVSELMTIDKHLSALCAQAGMSICYGRIDDLEKAFAGHARAVNMTSSIIDSATDSSEGTLRDFRCSANQRLVFGALGTEVSDRSLVDKIFALLIEKTSYGCPTREPVETKS